jgi:hypothetical protein
MNKRSNKQVEETLTIKSMTAIGEDRKQEEEREVLDRKIAIATDGISFAS